jgi:hypothetical protein
MTRHLTLLAAAALFTLSGCGSSSTTEKCLGGSTKCGDTCVSLETDQLNCGTCGNACAAGLACAAGSCVASETCLGTSTKCGDTCVSLETDQLNCGACGNACDPGLACAAGSCVASGACLGTSTKCGSSCVTLDTDQLNCGACGNACAPGLACSAGTCAATCAAGYASCDGTTCTDVQRAWNNCGACGNTCAGDEVCAAGTCGTWTTLAGPQNYGLPDFAPAGATALYAPSDANMEAYSIADDGWSVVAEGLSLPGGYAYPAWFGGSLYFIDGGYLYAYSIAGMTSGSELIDTMPSSYQSQATADDAGNVYAMASDGSIIQYNPATAALHVFTGPTDLPSSGDEPRLAWDTKTAKVYIADYASTPFYSLDPADGNLSPLEAFPLSNGVNDGFCSDRHGRIYTSDDSGNGGVAMMFDTTTGMWSQMPFMPFEIGSSGACTVSGDGYLYFTGNGGTARIRVF